METFESLQAQAEEYYQTPEYLSGVDVIRKIFDQIRERLIAFDLDMTLISDTLDRLNGMDISEKNVFFRRPYANETLDIVGKSTNRLMLWTGANMGRVQRAQSVAGLVLPENMRVVVRDENRLMNLEKLHDPSSGVVSPYDDDCDDDDSCSDGFEDGYTKVPSFFGVDLLFDDLADEHIGIGSTYVRNYADERKFIKVSPFDLDRMIHPSLHRFDFGLLSAAITAGEMFGVKTDRTLLDDFMRRYDEEARRHHRLARLFR